MRIRVLTFTPIYLYPLNLDPILNSPSPLPLPLPLILPTIPMPRPLPLHNPQHNPIHPRLIQNNMRHMTQPRFRIGRTTLPLNACPFAIIGFRFGWAPEGNFPDMIPLADEFLAYTKALVDFDCAALDAVRCCLIMLVRLYFVC
jgi:hypothetical protein